MSASGLVFATAGYGLAGAAFLFLFLSLLTSLRKRPQGFLLVAAAAVTVVWAGSFVGDSTLFMLTPFHIFVLELAVDVTWLMFLSGLMSGAVGSSRIQVVRYGGVLIAAGILVVGIGLEIAFRNGYVAVGASRILVIGSVLTALAALISVEQIYRNARESQRTGLKFLCLGVGAIFAFDLFLYSNAMLFGEISQLFWSARGYVVALSAPLVAIAISRSPSWSAGVFVSRQIVFYTATVIAAGVYLTVIGFAGYYIKSFSGMWGPVAQVVFFSASIIALFVFLFSDSTRNRLRVFISKHFYQSKYDYRVEWLRLSDTLTSSGDGMPLKKRAIQALAQIIDSPSGVLWLISADGEEYRAASNWNTSEHSGNFMSADSLPEFMRRTEWIIEISEYLADPSHYRSLQLDADSLGLKNPALLIPLCSDADMIGFVALSTPVSELDLNYEDRDLLKAAGKQVASYLMQDQATELLAQGRQFEAFNKLTAYIMHDLKNIIAQQSLVVENAKKHKHNPAFVDDAIATIDGGVARMRRVIEQLQQRSSEPAMIRAELGTIILKAVSQCADRDPAATAHVGDDRIWVRADPERLQTAVYHAIRNAQDATGAGGAISVTLSVAADASQIVIKDNGCGMDEAFLRERLFKPFDSTKGTQGMGIGAYQIRETLRSIGGSVKIESCVGRGTTVTLLLNKV